MTGCYRQWSVGQLTAVFSEMLGYAMQQEQQQQKIYCNKFKDRNLRLIANPTNYRGTVNKRVSSEANNMSKQKRT